MSKITVFYGTRCLLSWPATWIQFTTYFLKINFDIILASTPLYPNWSPSSYLSLFLKKQGAKFPLICNQGSRFIWEFNFTFWTIYFRYSFDRMLGCSQNSSWRGNEDENLTAPSRNLRQVFQCLARQFIVEHLYNISETGFGAHPASNPVYVWDNPAGTWIWPPPLNAEVQNAWSFACSRGS